MTAVSEIRNTWRPILTHSSDHYETLIQYPVYIGEQPPLFYEWGMSTVPQTQLDGATRSVPMGKGVGGGSLINGMIWNRGSQSDFDSWAELNDDEGWSWGSMVPFFKKVSHWLRC